MSKIKYPVTAAIRFLREHQVSFEPKEYTYVEHGGTAQSALSLGVAEHAVIKTIVLQNEHKQGLIVLMHGDRHISTRKLARDLGMKHIEPASPQQANKWTGYLVGGTSPFGNKADLPVYVEESIYALPRIYINGGKRGFLVEMCPQDLICLQPRSVQVATEIT
jgi:Cys-tRNA(Pro) deacylase